MQPPYVGFKEIHGSTEGRAPFGNTVRELNNPEELASWNQGSWPPWLFQESLVVVSSWVISPVGIKPHPWNTSFGHPSLMGCAATSGVGPLGAVSPPDSDICRPGAIFPRCPDTLRWVPTLPHTFPLISKRLREKTLTLSSQPNFSGRGPQRTSATFLLTGSLPRSEMPIKNGRAVCPPSRHEVMTGQGDGRA